MIKSFCILTFELFLIFVVINFSHAASIEPVKRHQADPWVIYHQLKVPDQTESERIEGGVHYLLVDNQVKVEKKNPSFFSRYAEFIINQQGLERASQIDITFDPAYETLVLHSLNVIRNGKTIDQIANARMSVIQRETELENLIYDGQLSFNAILNDVRVGDIVDYSYTISGLNPVYNNIFAYRRYVEWSVPIYQQKLRVLWGKSQPLYVTRLNTDIGVRQKQRGAYQEYSVNIEDVAPRFINNQIPKWHDPFGLIFFSELKSWAEVSSWARPLYDKAFESGNDLEDIVLTIKNKYPALSQQIVQALKFVQSEIRYMGIEMGVNSHTPSPASVTLSRRYGDCKDKAVLLISLLHKLGVEAAPALVNTSRTRQLKEFPPTIDAFNHVIVQARHESEIFWLDPTRQYQQGKLEEIYQPDYHVALVIEKGTTDLQRMHKIPGVSQLVVNEKFDLTQGAGKPVSHEVRSEYIGYEAEKQRHDIAEDGLNSLQKKYLEFYADYYSTVEPVDKIRITEDESHGRVIAEEKYLFKDFWKKIEDEKKFEASFFANSIYSILPKPSELNRNSPYLIYHPINIQQTIEVAFDSDEWSFDKEEFNENNQFFSFKHNVSYNKSRHLLTLKYSFITKTDHVPVKDFDTFMAARKRTKDLTEFPIVQYFDSTIEDKDTAGGFDSSQLLLIGFFLIYFAGIVSVIINWRIDAKKQPVTDTPYYPVSLIKLFFLCFFTFGLYNIYWFYRNWLYTKNQDQSSIMPTARGIFNYFWYYPLYNRLVSDSTLRYQENRLLTKPVAVSFAIVYLLLNIIGNFDYLTLPLLIIAPLLLFPMASYINNISTDKTKAYNYNSRWLVRHTAVVILFLPIIAMISASDLQILPGDSIVEGNKIWGRDIKFMQRKGILPANEKLILFYSDAFINIRKDGNGFTDNRVFSYWRDEDSGFNIESEKLSRVKDIEVSFSQKWTENTTITVVREDGSNFILYVSHEKGLDKKFVKELKARWKNSRGDAKDFNSVH